MDLQVLPLHKHPEYLKKCCQLVNDEWKRSDTARLRSFESSCDTLPVNLILLANETLVGHLKLTIIPSLKDACFVESVVIDKTLRGKGYGSYLMLAAEKHCKCLNLNTIFLSTNGQAQFYSKLGYSECTPVSIYGSFNSVVRQKVVEKSLCTDKVFSNDNSSSVPVPPPMPLIVNNTDKKIFMNKIIL